MVWLSLFNGVTTLSNPSRKQRIESSWCIHDDDVILQWRSGGKTFWLTSKFQSTKCLPETIQVGIHSFFTRWSIFAAPCSQQQQSGIALSQLSKLEHLHPLIQYVAHSLQLMPKSDSRCHTWRRIISNSPLNCYVPFLSGETSHILLCIL